MRNAFIEELTLLSEDPNVLAMLSDNGIIVFDKYREKYDDQFINFGIAEANSIGVSAGMASCGYIPFVYSISPFVTTRVYEQIRNDICYQNMNVKIIGTGAGFAYSTLGPTHHATEDITFMRILPNMTVISPADPLETRKAARAAYEHKGPVYMRIGTGRNPEVYQEDYDFQLGKGVTLRSGKDIALISTGTILHEVLETSEMLESQGISTTVINIHTIKPIDESLILETAQNTSTILTIEEHTTMGGLGGAVAEVLIEQHQGTLNFKRLGLNGVFGKGYGSVDDIRRLNGLSKEHILAAAHNLLDSKK